jgi:rhodanese-related sulfurtransferase
MGAVNFPKSWITQDAHIDLPVQRDIYVYGNDEVETVQAANLLRQAGYQKVAELKGGLSCMAGNFWPHGRC